MKKAEIHICYMSYIDYAPIMNNNSKCASFYGPKKSINEDERWIRDNEKLINHAEDLMRSSCILNKIAPVYEKNDSVSDYYADDHIENLVKMFWYFHKKIDKSVETCINIIHLAYINVHTNYFYYEQMIRNIQHTNKKMKEKKKNVASNTLLIYEGSDIVKNKDTVISEFYNN